MRRRGAIASLLLWTSTAGAQAQASVTLYGRAYALLESIEVEGSERFARLTNQASLLGVRGRHEEGGVTAWFQLETGFQIDTGGGGFANRNSGVGLAGTWGTLLAGRWDSPFEQSQVGVVDPFSDLGLADITGGAVQQGNFARRQSNTLQYWSPSWGGARVKLMATSDEERTANARPRDYGGSLEHMGESHYVALAYERHRDQQGATPAPGHSERGFGVAAFKRFTGVKVMAQAGQYHRTGHGVERSFLVGFDATSGPHSLLVSYQGVSGGGSEDANSRPRCSIIGVGYRYSFSVRTFVIAELARVANEAVGVCNFGSNPITITPGQDLRGLGMGLRTVF